MKLVRFVRDLMRFNIRSIRLKLALLEGVIGFVGIFLIFILTWSGARYSIIRLAITDARNLSDQISYSVTVLAAQEGAIIFNIQRMVEKVATLSNIKVARFISPTGVILADNNQGNIGQNVVSPLLTNVLSTQADQQQLDASILTYVRPIHGQAFSAQFNDVIGILWIEMDINSYLARTQQDLLLVLGISLLVLTLVFIWYSFITKTIIVDRLRIISDGLVKVQEGDVNQKIQISSSFGSSDELNDVADQFNSMTSALKYKLFIEKMVATISARFVNVQQAQLAHAIDETLSELGEFFQADRCYIFELDKNSGSLNNTFEWCFSGVEPQIENLQGLPENVFPWWMENLRNGAVVRVSRVDDLPSEAAAEKEILSSQGIQSVVVAPMLSNTGLFGFLGFDAVRQVRVWTDEEVRLLTIVTDALTNTIIRFKSQAEIQVQSDFALQVMQTVEQGLIVTDLQGCYEYVNPAYARMLELPAEQLIGHSPTDFTHPDDRAGMQAQRDARLKGITSTYSSRLITPNGKVVYVLISATPRMRQGKIIGSIAAITNLTEQMQAEEKLRQSEARNRAFLDAIPDLIFRIDREGTFLDFRANAGMPLYAPAEEIVGANLRDILPPDVARKAFENIQTAFDTGQQQNFEYELVVNGRVNSFDAHVVASSANECIVVVHDISERARLEQMKSDFINRASHELRTPLTTAILMVDLLDTQNYTSDEDKEYWTILRQEMNRQRVLLEDLLTVGRLESGRSRIKPVPTLVVPVLEKSMQAIYPQADQQKINITSSFDDYLPTVSGTDEALARVFINLLSNAVKFSQPGGDVALMARNHEEGVLIEIQDHGIGIPQEDLAHISSRFFRAANAIHQEIQGSGIGLYIVTSIVDELGGHVNITSTLNQGTTVSVWLPVMLDTVQLHG